MTPTSPLETKSTESPAIDASDNQKRSTQPALRSRRASRGQILILFAGAVVALVGMLGVATDLGFGLAERRTMQNAADAGALAGAHTIAKSDPLVLQSVWSDVQSSAQANKLGNSAPTVSSCTYVDDNDQSLGDCSLTIPPTATGVHVYVTETHSTFFLRAIPGGPKTLTTRASAIAHVQYLASPPGDGPFLVCGIDPQVDSGPNNIDIVKQVGSTWVLNPAAVTTSTHDGPTFQVYGPQVAQCGLPNSSYKGLALGDDNQNLTVPNWFYYSTGDKAGQLSVSVDGVAGCTPAKIINCVAFLPIAVDSPVPNTTTDQMWTVMILPFYLTQATYSNGVLNKLDGKVMGDYISEGNGKPGFIPGTQSPIVIRLTR